jgi:hypothetical protein
MLKRFALPPRAHDHARYRVWNRRGYDMNIWSEKKGEAQLHAICFRHAMQVTPHPARDGW